MDMDDQQASEFIRSALTTGKTTEEIYSKLITEGFSVDKIQSLFSGLSVKREEVDTQQHTIRIILIIAAVLVGAGVLSFFASNWQVIPKFIKVLLIIVTMIVSYWAGWYWKTVAYMAKTGDALILLGVIIYGAGIFLVAQMFNIRINWPDGFILWMLGAMAMSYAINLKLIFVLTIILGIIAVFTSPFKIMDGPGGQALMTSSFLLTVATIALFASAFFLRKKSLLKSSETSVQSKQQSGANSWN